MASLKIELAVGKPGKSKSPAEPLTRGSGTGQDKNPYARIGRDDKENRRKRIERWFKAYKRGGPYADAIDSYHLFALSNGWDLLSEKEDEELKNLVIAWCDQEQVDLDQIMQDGILSAKLAGDAYQEIVWTNDQSTIWGVITRDPSQFEKKVDVWGRVEEFIQYTKSGNDLQETPREIPPDAIINLILDQIPGSIYGQSIWDRAEDNIDQDCDIMESIASAMHRHGTPKSVWNLGSEVDRATDADIKDFRKEIEEFNAKTDMVVTHDTKYSPMDTAGISNVDVYSNVSLQRTACSLGVPEEILGLGRGSTEATATVRMDAFLKRVQAIQKRVARTYSRRLIDQITGKPGAVWIEFKPIKQEDFLKLADAVSKLRAGMDPDAVAYSRWAQERLGIPPDDEQQETG